MRQHGGLPGLLGLGLGGLGGLHLGGQRLGAGEQRLLLLALGLRDLLAERLLLAPLGLEVGDRLRGARVGRQRLVDHLVGQPALGLGGTHAVGVVSEDARVDHASRLVAAPGAAHARLHRSSAVDVRRCLLRGPTPSYFCPCSTAPASSSWAGPLLSFLLFGAGAASRSSRAGVRSRSSTTVVRPRPSTRWTRAGCIDAAARHRGRCSGPSGMTIMTTVVAVLMLVRGHRRAAFFTVGVMIATIAGVHRSSSCWSAGTRPEWQIDRGAAARRSPSRPGTPSSVTAFGGIVIVLVVDARAPRQHAPAALRR